MSPFHGRNFDPALWRILPIGTALVDDDEAWSGTFQRWVEVRDYFGLVPESVTGLGLVVKPNEVVFRRRLDAISMLGQLGVRHGV